MDWINSLVTLGGYIVDDRLKDRRINILVTYETAHGRKYVKQVMCDHGRVTKKLNGRIIAWKPLDQPFNW